ncbi:unnamed protein product, partial [Effrenium voratum]
QVLVEEQAIELPQANIVEVVREELAPVYQEVVKQVPKVSMDYIERVVEVETSAVNESSPRGQLQGYHTTQQRYSYAPQQMYAAPGAPGQFPQSCTVPARQAPCTTQCAHPSPRGVPTTTMGPPLLSSAWLSEPSARS